MFHHEDFSHFFIYSIPSQRISSEQSEKIPTDVTMRGLDSGLYSAVDAAAHSGNSFSVKYVESPSSPSLTLGAKSARCFVFAPPLYLCPLASKITADPE